ncbi:MAG TPA: DUF202 domain-containing protein [Chthoniobacterales bacterium]|jgi:putative membrane protein
MSERSGEEKKKPGQLSSDKVESEILANERTLAWVRTSIAVMSLGFVIAKFSLWMRQMSSGLAPQTPVHHLNLAVPLGECMIGAGALLSAFAGWRYHVVNRAIERGEIKADPVLVFVITAIMVGTAIAVISYMAISAQGN